MHVLYLVVSLHLVANSLMTQLKTNDSISSYGMFKITLVGILRVCSVVPWFLVTKLHKTSCPLSYNLAGLHYIRFKLRATTAFL